MTKKAKWETSVSSTFDIPGIKFGFAAMPVTREFKIDFPVKYKDTLIEQNTEYGHPIITYRYDNGSRFQKTKFMWAGETETLDPSKIIKYLGFCRIQGELQHLLIIK